MPETSQRFVLKVGNDQKVLISSFKGVFGSITQNGSNPNGNIQLTPITPPGWDPNLPTVKFITQKMKTKVLEIAIFLLTIVFLKKIGKIRYHYIKN